ncbi:DUF6236 family protein [Lentzea sp. BCCO 10_0061]|uniref:DUF6236 family protein n=1 Tax=Lentzea sokolovensis TaxID=3095429 RepID=A0ABU4UZJ1_9PSEU|nr:DUF6236 family protein [Lentzea sp. BCCO 10_0061]MDX8144894.1 DUF6236 family protein [Lentzea sp. BCCO 10_0061]
MSTHNEINGPVQGTAVQVGHLQHVTHVRDRVSAIAFYYPYIHIRDDTWLKYAAMYWPVITRLVPQNYRPADSRVSTRFANAGVLSDLSAASTSFADSDAFLHVAVTRPDELRTRFGVEKRAEWDARAVPSSAGPAADPRLTYLHHDRLSRGFADVLVEHGLGERHSVGGENWLGMHPDLATVYMCLLANRLAERESLHPVTDQVLPHDALLEPTADRITEVLFGLPSRSPRLQTTQKFITAAVQTVIPEGLADVPVEKILELRETFPKDFHQFRAHVGDRFAELRADATTSLHVGVAVDELVRAELADLEDKLRSVKLVPRRVRVWLKADAVRESPVGWLFRAGQALR